MSAFDVALVFCLLFVIISHSAHVLGHSERSEGIHC